MTELSIYNMKRFLYIATLCLFCASCGTAVKTATKPLTNAEYVDAGASFNSVTMTDKESAQYSNMIDYIKDKVPGVQAEGSGGTSTKLIVRGVSSLKGSNDPLIIVDGNEVVDINIVDPEDVYSVDVLKDASASIYGVKGSAGVIVINTKHARFEAEQARIQKKAAKEAKKKK